MREFWNNKRKSKSATKSMSYKTLLCVWLLFSMFCFEKPIFSILSIHTHRLTHCTSTCWFNETYTLTHKIPYNNIQSGGDGGGVGDGGGDDDDVVVFLRLSMHTRIHARARSCARSRRVSFNELNWRRAREWEYVSVREREGLSPLICV